MTTINITSNAPELSRSLRILAGKQVPFATSKTVNELAVSVKKIEQKKLDDYFEIRTTWLTKRGAIPIKFSKKRDNPIVSTLTVKDDVAVLAATGGTRKNEGSDPLAIPYSNTGNGKSTRQELNPSKRTLPRSKWPSKIVKKTRGRRGRKAKKPKPFYLKSRTTGKLYVARRIQGVRGKLQILYGFEKQVEMKQTWPFIKNVERYVDRNFDRRFKVELTKAIRNSK